MCGRSEWRWRGGGKCEIKDEESGMDEHSEKETVYQRATDKQVEIVGINAIKMEDICLHGSQSDRIRDRAYRRKE